MDPFVGEIRAFAFPMTPPNWLPCDGRQMSIEHYTPLYGVLGSAFGSDGKTYFNLPDLRGKVVICQGTGSDGIAYSMGQAVGASTVALVAANMPSHSHALNAQTAASASSNSPGPTTVVQGVVYSPDNQPTPYPSFIPPTGQTTTPMAAEAVASALGTGSAGAALAHENMQPYLVMQYCICTEGIYP